MLVAFKSSFECLNNKSGNPSCTHFCKQAIFLFLGRTLNKAPLEARHHWPHSMPPHHPRLLDRGLLWHAHSLKTCIARFTRLRTSKKPNVETGVVCRLLQHSSVDDASWHVWCLMLNKLISVGFFLFPTMKGEQREKQKISSCNFL